MVLWSWKMIGNFLDEFTCGCVQDCSWQEGGNHKIQTSLRTQVIFTLINSQLKELIIDAEALKGNLVK